MIACRICMANGHEAWKLPSGKYVCPMKIGDAMAKSEAAQTGFTLSTAEAIALRAMLAQLGEKASVLSAESARALSEFLPRLARFCDSKSAPPAGPCTCVQPNKRTLIRNRIRPTQFLKMHTNPGAHQMLWGSESEAHDYAGELLNAIRGDAFAYGGEIVEVPVRGFSSGFSSFHCGKCGKVKRFRLDLEGER